MSELLSMLVMFFAAGTAICSVVKMGQEESPIYDVPLLLILSGLCAYFFV